jgi:hypothetical protein
MENAYRKIESKENREATKKQIAIMYSKYSEKELGLYLKYITSVEGAWLNENVMKGFEAGYEACMQEAVRKLIDMFDLKA